MTVLRWAESNRAELRAELPDGLVVVPLGATEQHGPHLATGTDTVLVDTVATRAAERAGPRSERRLIIAPALPFGVSGHHLPFGGTLSLTAPVALGVIGDLARSVMLGGGRRLVLVNGHGGNRGVCHAAASAAAELGLAVAVLHYWDLLPDTDSVVPGSVVPGHAGEFETALMLAVEPGLVTETGERPMLPATPVVEGVEVHDAAVWQRIDGFTDNPALATAERGRIWLDQCVEAMSERFVELARVL